MPKIKVRIAVAVNPETLEWNSCGWGGGKNEPNDKEKMGFAVDPLPDGEVHYWLEGEIEIAPVKTITATVKEQ